MITLVGFQEKSLQSSSVSNSNYAHTTWVNVWTKTIRLITWKVTTYNKNCYISHQREKKSDHWRFKENMDCLQESQHQWWRGLVIFENGLQRPALSFPSRRMSLLRQDLCSIFNTLTFTLHFLFLGFSASQRKWRKGNPSGFFLWRLTELEDTHTFTHGLPAGPGSCWLRKDAR